MVKKYILGGIMAFCVTQCSSCNKQQEDSIVENDKKVDYIAELRSTFAKFNGSDRITYERLDKIAGEFEGIIRKGLPEKWQQSVDNVISTTTEFLKDISDKPGENLKDKVEVLQKIVSKYAEKIRKNISQSDKISDVQLLCLFENFKDCLANLRNTDDDFQGILERFIDCAQIFGILEPLFKTDEEKKQKMADIDRRFAQDYPINKIAKDVLKGLYALNLENLQKYIYDLDVKFEEKKDKNLSKGEMQEIIKCSNNNFFKCHQELVKLTVLNPDHSKDFIKALSLGNSNFTFLSVDEKSKAKKVEDVEIDSPEFLSRYISTFSLCFNHQYSLDLHKNDKDEWGIRFFLKNFDPKGKKFFVDLKGVDSVIKVNTTNVEGEEFGYVTFQQENPNKFFGDDKLLSLDEELYKGIQTLHLLLSAGFDIQLKNFPNTLSKTIDPDANHLLQYHLAHNKLEKFDDQKTKLALLGSVGNLWVMFGDALNEFNRSKTSTDNKEKFCAIWTVRNLSHYINQSCDHYLNGPKDDFVKTLLNNINKGQKDDHGNYILGIVKFWGDFLKVNGIDDKTVELALVEYLIIRCGLFSKDVNLGSNGSLPPKMTYGNTFNTLGVWKWNDIQNKIQQLPTIQLLQTLVQDLFNINQTIPQNMASICNAVLDQYLEDNGNKKYKNRLQAFLDIRNKFYTDYPQSIYSIRNKDDLKNFLITVAQVANEADKNFLFSDGQHNSFDWIVTSILKPTYSSLNILKHEETCLAPKEDYIAQYIAAYWIKFIENILQGSVIMDVAPTEIYQSLVKINSADDVNKLDLLNLIVANENRILERQEKRTSSESPWKNRQYDGYVTEKNGIGINYIVVRICKSMVETSPDPKTGTTIISNNTKWKERQPLQFGNQVNLIPTIQQWFNDFKIYVYTREKRNKHLYVGKNHAPNADFIQKQGDDLARFSIGSNISPIDYVEPKDTFYHSPTQILSASWREHRVINKANTIDFSTIKFLKDLFGEGKIVGDEDKIVGDINKPGIIFNFDYHGESVLCRDYPDPTDTSILKKRYLYDWIRVQNCQM